MLHVRDVPDKIEAHPECIQADFANEDLGGGVLSEGAV